MHCTSRLVKNGGMAEDQNLDEKPAHFLDLTQWPRRATFDFFRSFAQPFFSVCTRVDVAALKPALAQIDNSGHTATLTLACHYLALQLANRMAPFRYRLMDGLDGLNGLNGRVRVMAAVHASTTVLRADDSFGFAYLRHDSDYSRFAAHGAVALAAARVAEPAFVPRLGDMALLHFTTLPWLHFTSFAHARQAAGPSAGASAAPSAALSAGRSGAADSVPKIAFGRIDADPAGGPQRWLPLQVDVHHALMDGVHVGRFVQAFEAAMRDPLPWLQGGAVP